MFGKLLFGCQILAMLLCAFPLNLRWPLPLSLAIFCSAITLLLWVLLHNRLGNWSVLPQPKDSSLFIEKGPYRFMRHPMYSALILGAIGLVMHNQTLQSMLALVGLMAVLQVKARYEEKLLRGHFKEYKQYQQAVRSRFIPKLF